MAAAADLILLTGATGFLGYKILVIALKAGSNVRCAVRSESKIPNILSAPFLKALNPSSDQLTWIVIPDMTAPGAYDKAVEGAKYVIHAASPIPSFGEEPLTAEMYEEFFVQAARKGTIGMLETARKAGTVKRVVITSSVVANIPFSYFLGMGDDQIFNAESRISEPEGSYNFEFEAYSASKTAALNAAEAWIEREKPNFDLISINAGWIFGKDELNTKVEDFKTGSNSVLLGMLLGGKSDIPYNSNSVLVDDVARLHVLALDPRIRGNQDFVAAAGDVDVFTWSDAVELVKKDFPEAVADRRLKTDGVQPTARVRIDAGKTENTFGFRMAGFEEQLVSLVKHYLAVSSA